MKLIVGIVAFTILYLTVQPAFASYMTRTETDCKADCCEHDCTTDAKDESENQGCSDFCNPLLKCGTNAFGSMEFFQFNVESPIKTLDKTILLPQALFSQFSPDFWQPPKLA